MHNLQARIYVFADKGEFIEKRLPLSTGRPKSVYQQRSQTKFPGQAVNELYAGSSIETVAFQVFEILKINHEFLQFFWLGSKI